MYNRLFDHEKEWNSDTCYNMDEPQNIMLTEVSQHKRTNNAGYNLFEVPRIGKFIEAESRRKATRGWGWR